MKNRDRIQKPYPACEETWEGASGRGTGLAAKHDRRGPAPASRDAVPSPSPLRGGSGWGSRGSRNLRRSQRILRMDPHPRPPRRGREPAWRRRPARTPRPRPKRTPPRTCCRAFDPPSRGGFGPRLVFDGARKPGRRAPLACTALFQNSTRRRQQAPLEPSPLREGQNRQGRFWGGVTPPIRRTAPPSPRLGGELERKVAGMKFGYRRTIAAADPRPTPASREREKKAAPSPTSAYDRISVVPRSLTASEKSPFRDARLSASREQIARLRIFDD